MAAEEWVGGDEMTAEEKPEQKAVELRVVDERALNDARAAERLAEIAVEQGRVALVLMIVCTVCYAGLLSRLVPQPVFRGWFAAMALLIAARVGVVALHARIGRHDRPRWLILNAWSLFGCGLGLGVSPLWLEIPGQISGVALANLWLGGLAAGALLSQGPLRWHGLAFALPALAPLELLLLASGDPTLLSLGSGNLLFFVYLFHVIQRNQSHTIRELYHRLEIESIAERLAREQTRSKRLVNKLVTEIERRRKAQTALIEARNRARELSNLDPLTNLANRRAFERALEREWDRAHREQRPLSLVLCDLDRFRQYNERYGHHAGDKCLVRVGRIVAEYAKRSGDLVARFGAEEFAILLPGTSELAALEVADSIRADIYEMTLMHGASDVENVLTASCGAATIVPTAGQRTEQLIDAASHALQRAKRAGRNCVFTVSGALEEQDENG